jgi:LmbE family N-acetylglucosaminyl deacetylase
MTDGTSSHANLIAADELAALRHAEGHAAAQALGVESADVYAFDFKDSQLAAQANEATDRVSELLRSTNPQDVFVPYCRDRLADHVATHRIVMSAIEAIGVNVMVYEYAIWFWQGASAAALDVGQSPRKRPIHGGVSTGAALSRSADGCRAADEARRACRASIADHATAPGFRVADSQ